MKKTRLGLALVLTAAVTPAGLWAQNEDAAYARKRQEMVELQLRSRDITDRNLLRVMSEVPRHLFVDSRLRAEAYEDYPLPIEEGQTISQPYIVALMTQCLELKGGENVLEVGTGSGYQAAVLERMGARVYSIEIHDALAKKAAALLKRLGYGRAEVRSGDGYFGWPEAAPFDAIIITCAPDRIPDPLFNQLREGGRLIVPVGEAGGTQTLTLVRKIQGKPKSEQVSLVRFVPMTGAVKK
jgi:protein-L-isoaspartate(D-aspartate) O-methyltransferase